MIIYKMTHLPTGKYYIGSLQRSKIWHRYLTSSKTVKAMMKASPHEWKREILKQYAQDYDPQLLVDEEYSLIDEAVELVGWDGIWNQRGSTNLGSSGYSPEARAKQVASAKDPIVIAKSRASKKAYVEANPDYFDRISATAKATWNTPEMLEVAKQRAIKQFANEENRKLASDIKKEYLAKNPEVAKKSIKAMQDALLDPIKESSRRQKIQATMAAKSEFFSEREKVRHAANPELGKQHGERLKALNRADPSRQERMSGSAKSRAKERPDLVANAVNAMNSEESRAKMKATHLAKSGKWVQITFADGEVLKILGANEAGRILGINKVKTKAAGTKLKKPIACSTDEYVGRVVTAIQYI
ncbi:hypothetical protein [Polynucleobacter sphagniphilus]|jgi:hypothetical protein|uniref:hypothetical protein n=1 Tax=Polynucleobacter sphagniphilus TaxID=1743169 RepID=UPI002404D545|nr:hypothetical protein [Polynucleobacter sphagniphilus]MDF9788105.1 hypothetical protein [Polynucleobacter sphagniphilus]